MPYFIGIDIGTSSTKAILIDDKGTIAASSNPEYSFTSPQPLWAESDPEDWWRATIDAIKDLLQQSNVQAKDVASIGITGQMHGLVLLDKTGRSIRPCIMWNDQRSHAQCDHITESIGHKQCIEHTGNPILPGFTAPKIAWVKANEPQAYRKISKILLPKDYIRYRLSGAFFTDVSDASGTSLFNVAKREWSDEMVAALELPRSWLPEATESLIASSKISSEAAQLTGLLEGTPIIAGAGDQAAQAIGCGIVKEGALSATLGTSGVVYAHSEHYRADPEARLHAFCSAVPEQWHLMGVMLSAAGSYQWYKNTFAELELLEEKQTGMSAYMQIDKLASNAPCGSEGLFFLPYLSGERTPHPDPHARAAFIGLSLRHTKKHMARSVLEGISYGMRDSLELIQNLKLETQTIIASGGGSKSKLWRLILANIFRQNVHTVNSTEGASYGAALLAATSTGAFNNIQAACDSCIKTTDTVSPNNDAEIYEKHYPLYQKLYPALKAHFNAVAQLPKLHLP